MDAGVQGPQGAAYSTRTYILHKDKNAYVFTFSMLQSDVKELKPLADKAMRTMKFEG